MRHVNPPKAGIRQPMVLEMDPSQAGLTLQNRKQTTNRHNRHA